MDVILNLTPHPITIVDEQNNITKVIEPRMVDGKITPARLKSQTVMSGWIINGIPLTKTVFGEPQDLPDKQNGTWLIVSQLIKNALPERKDLLVPADVVRDENGNIIGCKTLGC